MREFWVLLSRHGTLQLEKFSMQVLGVKNNEDRRWKQNRKDNFDRRFRGKGGSFDFAESRPNILEVMSDSKGKCEIKEDLLEERTDLALKSCQAFRILAMNVQTKISTRGLFPSPAYGRTIKGWLKAKWKVFGLTGTIENATKTFFLTFGGYKSKGRKCNPALTFQQRDSPMGNEAHSNKDSPQQIHTQTDSPHTVSHDISHEPQDNPTSQPVDSSPLSTGRSDESVSAHDNDRGQCTTAPLQPRRSTRQRQNYSSQSFQVYFI
nr:hypothetical protein Iba_chr05cCG7940 [Ipomoea batatas]